MRPLRILVLNLRDIRNPAAGGAEEHLHQIFRRLAGRGHAVSLWCGRSRGAPHRETVDGIDIRRRGGRLTNALWSMLRHLRRRRDFDVIVDYTCQLHFLTPLYVRRPRVAVALHIVGDAYRHDLRFPVGHLLAGWESFSLTHLYGRESFIAISPSTAAELGRLGIPPERIRLVMPGRSEPGPARRAPRPEPTLLYFGRIKRYKRVEMLIDALPAIRARVPGARLDVVGAGDQLPRLRRRVAARGLEGAVTFHGRLPADRLWEVVAAAWVNVQPSLVEGWGMTVVEAAQCGVPSVASRVPGLRDTVVDGRTGLLFDTDRPEQLVDSVTALLLDGARRRRLGDEAERWSRTFSWAAAADGVEAALEAVAARGEVACGDERPPVPAAADDAG